MKLQKNFFLFRDLFKLSVLVLFWTTFVVSLVLNAQKNEKLRIQLMLTNQARAFFSEVVLTRSWNASHGGVYVFVNESTSPNPYLDDPERDIKLQDGRILTKINPAFMTRQIAELAEEKNNIRFHITSLNPIRPANKANEWESAALEKFESGVMEYTESITLADDFIFRYMAPLVTEKSCLKCHSKQGYKVGEIRGGISITIPGKRVLEISELTNRPQVLGYIVTWILGMLFLIVLFINLIYQKTKAEAANAAKSDFIAHMSHDIRTPLSNMLGILQILKEDNNEDQSHEARKSLIEMAESSGENLFSIISDIIDMKEIESGKYRINEKNFRIEDLIVSLQSLFKLEMEKRKITFVYEIDGNLSGVIKSDEIKIRHILLNLIGNSIKYTEKGLISVKFHLLETKTRILNVQAVVEDTGVGIPANDLKNIVKPFERVKKYIGKVQGTGLGLSIVNKLVSILGGVLEIESEEGSGTKISFTFRAYKSDESFLSDDFEKHDTRTYSILLADDDAIGRKMVEIILKKLGHNVETVSDGSEVIEKMIHEKYDLILMDIEMQNMNGIQTVRHIRETLKNKNIPIIAVTANAIIENLNEYVKYGFNSWLVKPVQMKDLQNKITEIMKK